MFRSVFFLLAVLGLCHGFFPLYASEQTQSFTLSGEYDFGYLGVSVSTIGDVNGDGVADFVAGSPGALNDTGLVYVIYGTNARGPSVLLSSFDTTMGFRIMGANLGDRTGIQVSGGDINKDGLSDIIVVSRPLTAPPTIAVVYGSSTATDVNLLTLVPSQGFYLLRGFGSVSAVRDLNQDGINDILVGNPEESRATIIYGAVGNTRGDLLFSQMTAASGYVLNGDSGTEFGASVATGDVNGDGLFDVIVGAPGTGNGTVYVIYGVSGGGAGLNVSDLTAVTGYQISGDDLGTFGSSVSCGDVNADNVTDILATDPRRSATFAVYGTKGQRGNVLLSSSDPSTFFKILGDPSVDSVNAMVTSGDVDGDGIADIIVGNIGRTFVVYGRSTTRPTLELATILPTSGIAISYDNADGQWFGYAVSAAGDVDSDGKVDIVVGAPYSTMGNVVVIYGAERASDPPTSSTTSTFFTEVQTNATTTSEVTNPSQGDVSSSDKLMSSLVLAAVALVAAWV